MMYKFKWLTNKIYATFFKKKLKFENIFLISKFEIMQQSTKLKQFQ